MATLRPRCPTPTHRTRTSSAWPRKAAGWAPSVKTWISARESCPTRARAVRTASPSRFGRSVAEAPRLNRGLDDHHLRARPQPAHDVESLALGANEARGRDVGRLHRSRRVEHDHDALRPVPHDRDGGTGEGQGQGEEGEQLQDQERVALLALEERRRLAIAQGRIPEEEAGHRSLAPPHLEEVQEHERDGQRTDEEGEG